MKRSHSRQAPIAAFLSTASLFPRRSRANLSRAAAVAPQVAFIFPGKTVQTYLSFKAYWEFAADNRASGWNGWVTLSFSPAPPEISPATESR
jgi:hypothetical protein